MYAKLMETEELLIACAVRVCWWCWLAPRVRLASLDRDGVKVN
jgi:hypothetical protein